MNRVCQTDVLVSLADLRRVLPEKPLYGAPEPAAATPTGWLLSPTPYPLAAEQVAELHAIGHSLHRFAKAVDTLYRTSLKEPEWAWVAALLHHGKPASLISFAHMNRLKGQFPLVIRPDLLVTEHGFALCEIDAVPGGIGFTGALHHAYQALGFSLVGAASGIPTAFLDMLLKAAPSSASDPFIAVVVSDEAGDYRLEMAWLVEQIAAHYPQIALVHPRQITLERNRLGFLTVDNRFQPIEILYRFFELFDLPNIPQIELIQYAIKKGLVFCTPPFKPHLEEKGVLALLHHPFLTPFWQAQLGEADFARLTRLVPESWILDPARVPPHAEVVPELRFQDRRLRDFQGLAALTQKQRQLVVKPSGFSPLAWGSRGVHVGHDLSQAQWAEAVTEALAQFEQTPHLLQRFENTRVEPYTYFHPTSGELHQGQGRTRLCPYYFVTDDVPQLVGVLATTCPKDKKVIHGMRDGVMHPTCVP